MKISVLLENSSLSPQFGCAHGLSLLVEWADKNMLIDTGPGNFFAENAIVLGKDLSHVQAAVISHGHRDHGGGLENLLRLNKKAPVCLHRNAMERHWAARSEGELKNISLDERLTKLYPGRIRFIENSFQQEDIAIFSSEAGQKNPPEMNRNLLKGEPPIRDDFDHELNVLIREGERTALFVGCAHKGIVNIIESCIEKFQVCPDLVVGGFHLSSSGLGLCESEESVRLLAEELKSFGCTYVTGHCTGAVPLKILKEHLGERLLTMHSGAVFTINSQGSIIRDR